MSHYLRMPLLALALLFSGSMQASPIILPGDTQIRHDITLLSDAGVISGPISTWPLPWAQIADDLKRIPEGQTYSPAVTAALARVRWGLQVNKAESNVRTGVLVRGGTEPQFIRSFDDTPRGEGEAVAHADFINGRFAGRLSVEFVADPEDDEEARLDGSWIGLALGNWNLAAGLIDRYWGPAWQGGLIISNNARPRPGVTLSRLRTTPFETKWLSWIGPWSMTFFTERLESDRDVSNALLAGFRFTFRPFQSLEVGISRTSQFGGEDNDVDLGTIADVVTGQTNQTNPSLGGGTGINQLGGIDLRWNLPVVNAAVYAEIIGEDEKSGRPFQSLGQAGLETWGGIGRSGASWRLVYEATDTQADIFDESNRQPNFGTAYNNFEFGNGYRYQGRVIGHPVDGDALIQSIRAVLVSAGGHEWRLVLTDGELNRGSVDFPRNGLTNRNEDVSAIDSGYAHQYRWGRLEAGLGYTRREFEGDSSGETHFWVGLGREFE